MTRRFNPPPSWPTPPLGWEPPPGWHPDPSWGPAPASWPLWVETNQVEPRRDASSTHRIFISYRRSDCQPQANGLYDGLTHRLTSSTVFMDIDSIPPGVEFEQHIRDEIKICDLVLVLIGDNWLDPRAGTTTRRIDEPNDFVRLEIENALASPRVRVLPVLVEGAAMPQPAELPESIRALARINAIELSDRRWTSDLERLSQAVERMRHDRDARIERERRSAYEMRNFAVRPAHPRQVPAGVMQSGPVTAGPQVRGADVTASGSTVLPARPPHVQAPGTMSTPTVGASPMVEQNRTSATGWVMVFLPAVTFGLASFVPALWSITQRKDDLRFRHRMTAFAIIVGLLGYLGLFLAGSAPSDAAGTGNGTRSDVGVAIWFVSLVVATIVAVLTRKPKPLLPGTAEELARRRRREEYRALMQRDLNLARSMGVGRPDLKRDYDDGGLLNLNALTVEDLVRFGQLSTEEAQRIVDVRHRLHGLSSVDEIAAYSDLPEALLSRLRQLAVFL